jgi:hypothetical protein
MNIKSLSSVRKRHWIITVQPKVEEVGAGGKIVSKEDGTFHFFGNLFNCFNLVPAVEPKLSPFLRLGHVFSSPNFRSNDSAIRPL